jgi:AraC-like DNA-binding protein
MATNLIVKELAQLLGMQTTIILVRRFSNRLLSVPTADNLHDLHPLVLTIGQAPAHCLCKQYGGTSIELPNEVNALLPVRNEEMVRRFVNDGESIRSIAYEFGLDRAYVQKLIDRAGHRSLRLSRSLTT